MTSRITVTGMVLSAMPIGDYDKRVVILTKETGKITAFAKGARKQTSALLACSQPFSFGQFQLYAGRSSYTIVSAEISNYFPELRNDLESIYYGYYFCEFADYLTRENAEASEILKLLYQSLRVLIKKPISYTLLRSIFEFKIMVLNGEGAHVFECVRHKGKKAYTGDEEETDFMDWGFSSSAGGLVCRQCRKSFSDTISVQPASIYTLQFITVTPVEKLFTFTVSELVAEELNSLNASYLKQYIDVKFKSLDFLNLNN